MTRRRVLCGLLLASAVLACAAGWLWMANARKPTRARFEQVKEGMSREHVTRLLGPPAEYAQYGEDSRKIGDFAAWRSDDAELTVLFNATGTANDPVVLDMWLTPRTPPTLTERIRRWLGL
jgi:hypothetical protein